MSAVTMKRLKTCCAAFLLALTAGFGVAVTMNVWLFRWCHGQPCAGTAYYSSIPGLVALAVMGWLVSRQDLSAPTAALLGGVAAVWLGASGAPLGSQFPLTVDFLMFPVNIAKSAFSIASSPVRTILGLLYVWPLITVGAIWPLFLVAIRRNRPRERRIYALFAGAMFLCGLVSELLVAPAAWSPAVNRRIAALRVPAYPSARADPFRYLAWSQFELHYEVPASTSIREVLTFYDQVFSGWHALDRSAQDAIWVDPSDSVGAWTYVILAHDASSGNSVGIAVTDIDRFRWQHSLRVATHPVSR
jgi:hypothetical protein